MHPQPPTASHIVDFPLFSEVIRYDLEQLDADPKAIITLLSLTLDQRGLWMIVAAFYRARKNATAALVVLEAFLDQMTKQGFSDFQLKPAFVLLSGCEMDLAHENMGAAARTNTSELPFGALEHFKRAEHWLHRAFGENPPMALVDSDLIQKHEITATAKTETAKIEATKHPAQKRKEGSEQETQTHADQKGGRGNELERVKAGRCKAEDDYARKRGARKRAEMRWKGVERDLGEDKRALAKQVTVHRGDGHRENNKWGHREPLVPMKQSQYRSSQGSSKGCHRN